MSSNSNSNNNLTAHRLAPTTLGSLAEQSIALSSSSSPVSSPSSSSSSSSDEKPRRELPEICPGPISVVRRVPSESIHPSLRSVFSDEFVYNSHSFGLCVTVTGGRSPFMVPPSAFSAQLLYSFDFIVSDEVLPTARTLLDTSVMAKACHRWIAKLFVALGDEELGYRTYATRTDYMFAVNHSSLLYSYCNMNPPGEESDDDAREMLRLLRERILLPTSPTIDYPVVLRDRKVIVRLPPPRNDTKVWFDPATDIQPLPAEITELIASPANAAYWKPVTIGARNIESWCADLMGRGFIFPRRRSGNECLLHLHGVTSNLGGNPNDNTTYDALVSPYYGVHMRMTGGPLSPDLHPLISGKVRQQFDGDDSGKLVATKRIASNQYTPGEQGVGKRKPVAKKRNSVSRRDSDDDDDNDSDDRVVDESGRYVGVGKSVSAPRKRSKSSSPTKPAPAVDSDEDVDDKVPPKKHALFADPDDDDNDPRVQSTSSKKRSRSVVGRTEIEAARDRAVALGGGQRAAARQASAVALKKIAEQNAQSKMTLSQLTLTQAINEMQLSNPQLGTQLGVSLSEASTHDGADGDRRARIATVALSTGRSSSVRRVVAGTPSAKLSSTGHGRRAPSSALPIPSLSSFGLGNNSTFADIGNESVPLWQANVATSRIPDAVPSYHVQVSLDTNGSYRYKQLVADSSSPYLKAFFRSQPALVDYINSNCTNGNNYVSVPIDYIPSTSETVHKPDESLGQREQQEATCGFAVGISDGLTQLLVYQRPPDKLDFNSVARPPPEFIHNPELAPNVEMRSQQIIIDGRTTTQWGCVANAPIEKGKVIGVYQGTFLPYGNYQLDGRAVVYRLAGQSLADATDAYAIGNVTNMSTKRVGAVTAAGQEHFCSVLRCANHSRDSPNAAFEPKFSVRAKGVLVKATRDIKSGEGVSLAYGTEYEEASAKLGETMGELGPVADKAPEPTFSAYIPSSPSASVSLTDVDQLPAYSEDGQDSVTVLAAGGPGNDGKTDAPSETQGATPSVPCETAVSDVMPTSTMALDQPTVDDDDTSDDMVASANSIALSRSTSNTPTPEHHADPYGSAPLPITVHGPGSSVANKYTDWPDAYSPTSPVYNPHDPFYAPYSPNDHAFHHPIPHLSTAEEMAQTLLANIAADHEAREQLDSTTKHSDGGATSTNSFDELDSYFK